MIKYGDGDGDDWDWKEEYSTEYFPQFQHLIFVKMMAKVSGDSFCEKAAQIIQPAR